MQQYSKKYDEVRMNTDKVEDTDSNTNKEDIWKMLKDALRDLVI